MNQVLQISKTAMVLRKGTGIIMRVHGDLLWGLVGGLRDFVGLRLCWNMLE